MSDCKPVSVHFKICWTTVHSLSDIRSIAEHVLALEEQYFQRYRHHQPSLQIQWRSHVVYRHFLIDSLPFQIPWQYSVLPAVSPLPSKLKLNRVSVVPFCGSLCWSAVRIATRKCQARIRRAAYFVAQPHSPSTLHEGLPRPFIKVTSESTPHGFTKEEHALNIRGYLSSPFSLSSFPVLLNFFFLTTFHTLGSTVFALRMGQVGSRFEDSPQIYIRDQSRCTIRVSSEP